MILDYEQKYKEALEKARQLCAYPTSKPFESDLQDIFPELKKSELKKSDEMIREGIIKSIKDLNSDWLELHGVTKEEAIAWLEKQVDQKLTWSKDDENSLSDVLWCCKKAASIAKDENEMGTVWGAERWLKSLKSRL